MTCRCRRCCHQRRNLGCPSCFLCGCHWCCGCSCSGLVRAWRRCRGCRAASRRPRLRPACWPPRPPPSPRAAALAPAPARHPPRCPFLAGQASCPAVLAPDQHASPASAFPLPHLRARSAPPAASRPLPRPAPTPAPGRGLVPPSSALARPGPQPPCPCPSRPCPRQPVPGPSPRPAEAPDRPWHARAGPASAGAPLNDREPASTVAVTTVEAGSLLLARVSLLITARNSRQRTMSTGGRRGDSRRLWMGLWTGGGKLGGIGDKRQMSCGWTKNLGSACGKALCLSPGWQ